MRRALGTLTPYDTFIKAVQENQANTLSEMVWLLKDHPPIRVDDFSGPSTASLLLHNVCAVKASASILFIEH
jgi:hypothetical protein